MCLTLSNSCFVHCVFPDPVVPTTSIPELSLNGMLMLTYVSLAADVEVFKGFIVDRRWVNCASLVYLAGVDVRLEADLE